MFDAETAVAGQAGLVADQRRARPARRRARAGARPARRPLGGAVLDAFREEPLPADSVFYSLPNVIVTPHTSWSSGRALDRSVELFCDNLRRYTRGEPLLNLVDPRRGLLATSAGRDSRTGPVGQDNRFQHAHPRPGRDRRLWRRDRQRRRGQGARRPADQADRAVQAQARGPGRRDLCRPAGAAAVGGRTRAGRDPGRPAGPTAHGRRAAARGACFRRPGGGASRSARSTRGGTSSSSTSSSCWPTLAWSRSASRSCRRPGPPRHAGRARGQRARARGPGAHRARRCARASRFATWS